MDIILIATVATFHEKFNKSNMILLKEMGLDVHVISNFSENNFSEKNIEKFKLFCSENDIKIVDIKIPRSPLKLFDFFSALHKTVNYAIVKNSKLIHGHTPIGGIIARLVAKKLDILSIYTVHGYHFHRTSGIFSWLFFYPIERLTAFKNCIAVTINQQDYLVADKMGYKNVYKISGVGVSINQSSIETLVSRSDHIKLIAVGELNKNKNHSLLIKLVQKMRYKYNLKLLIIGEGNHRRKIERLIDKYGLHEQVELIGYVDDVQDRLVHSDIFILPSYREGLSKALMESMSAGLPILASNIRGNEDLIEDGSGGYLFDPKNLSDLISKFECLVKNKSQWGKMGLFNKNTIQLYSQEIVNNQMLQIYKGAIQLSKESKHA
jgi:glycosyltransferase involved in cell wall biosynthesis